MQSLGKGEVYKDGKCNFVWTSLIHINNWCIEKKKDHRDGIAMLYGVLFVGVCKIDSSSVMGVVGQGEGKNFMEE